MKKIAQLWSKKVNYKKYFTLTESFLRSFLTLQLITINTQNKYLPALHSISMDPIAQIPYARIKKSLHPKEKIFIYI